MVKTIDGRCLNQVGKMPANVCTNADTGGGILPTLPDLQFGKISRVLNLQFSILRPLMPNCKFSDPYGWPVAYVTIISLNKLAGSMTPDGSSITANVVWANPAPLPSPS